MGLILRNKTQSFNSSQPTIHRDAIINAGTLWCFDFKNTACYDQAAQPTNSKVLNNLVDIPTPAPAGGFINASSTTLTYEPNSGGMAFPRQQNGAITLGNSYPLQSLNNFVVAMWVRTPDQVTIIPPNVALMSRSSGIDFGANNQFAIHSGAGGAAWQLVLMGSSQALATSFFPYPMDSIFITYQLAFSIVGGTVTTFVNGVKAFSDAIPFTLASSTRPILLGNFDGGSTAQYRGKIYRTWAENLAVSGRTALERIQSDYLLNHGRFN